MSSEEISSPIIESANSMILMNQPSVERFLPALTDDGVAFINSSLAEVPENPGIISIPASDMALSFGDVKSANVVIFGAFLHKKGFWDIEEAEQHIGELSATKSRKFEEINMNALRAGWEFVK
jgi:2-oxoglutarate ferredoxin oxidoreductase subunit gamma